MSDARPKLLLTRPAAQSDRFAQAFRARFGEDWPVLIAPLQQIVTRCPEVSEAAELIFTSESAVAPLVALSPAAGRRAWCVGLRTAAAAEKAGFRPIAGQGDGAALARQIIAAQPTGPLLLARGEVQAYDIASALNAAGIETHSACVYAQDPLPLPPEAIALLAAENPLLVPLFSPRSARLFADAAAAAQAPLWVAAISPAVATACAEAGASRIQIATAPDAESMLDALASLIAG